MFITSKLWSNNHDPKDVRKAIEDTLKRLNLEYIDLYLIHWPISFKSSAELFPDNDAGEPLYSEIDILDTWHAMEELVDAGLTKSIGISNFNIKQVDYIVDNARIQPVTNQFEVHPYFLNKELIAHCRNRNLVVTAYSPLGASYRAKKKILENEKLLEIAEKHNKTPAQVLLRYQVQIGNVSTPQSVTKHRIISNLDVFDFALSDDEIKELESLGYIERTCPVPRNKDHPDYPFKDD